ncbi:mucin-3A-like [Xenia sp. Carnegie-2017]|uniref:mucin-3A-like n=1 Tax=Xenia sp. Carnegie-2017 TaxID=2897299 RepID=UPI001F04A25E|nr:mucin-3A-like [Xenia sp. Carnegie-2017]
MLNVMFLSAILVINGILVVSSDPIVPEQIECDEGEPLIDSTSPDINITVLPEVFINKSSPVIVVCDADIPRFLPPQNNYSLLQTVKIDIHLGTFLLKSCDKSLVSQCIHKIKNFSAGLPTTFSCTATNARNECRFKFKDISILAPLTTKRTIECIAPTIISEIKSSINQGVNETTLIPLLINETKFYSTSLPVKLTSKGQTAFPQTTVEITAAPITTNTSTDILRAIVPSKILSSSLIELSPITTTVSSTTDETTTISSVNVSSTAASLTPSKTLSSNGVPHTPSINETTISPLLTNETKFSSTSLPVLTFTTFQKSILQTSRILPTSLFDLSSITTADSSTIVAINISSVNVSSKAVSVTPSKQYSTTSTTPAILKTIIPKIKTTSKPTQTGINETILIPLLINETKFSSTSPPVKLTSKGQTAFPQTTVEITAAPITTNTSTDILRAIVPSKILSSSLIKLPPITTNVSSTTDETTAILSLNVSSTAASLKPSSINETTVSPLLINETKFSSTSVPVLRFTTFPKSILQTSRISPTLLSDLSTITTAVSSTIFTKNISSVNVSSKAVSVTPSKQYSTTSTTPAILKTIIPKIKATSKPTQTGINETILIPLLINETKFSSTSPPVKLTRKGQTAFPQTTVEITAPPITTKSSTDILRAIVPSKILSSLLIELPSITTSVSSTTDETTIISSVNVSSTVASLTPSSINETTVSPLLINETKFSSTSVPVLRFTTFPKSILQTSRILPTSLSDLSSITTAVSSTIFAKNISSVNVSSKAVSVTPSKQYSTTSTTPAILKTIIPKIKTTSKPTQTGINETILIPLLINETKFSSTSPPVKLTSKGQTAFPQTTVEITAPPITTNTSTDILRAIVPSKILSSSLIELPPITTNVSSTTDETTTILSVNVSSTAASLKPSSINETTVSPLLINETKFSSTSVPVLRFTTFPKSILQTSRILPTSLSDLSTITTAVSSTIFAKNISSVNVSSKAVSVTPSKQYSTTSTTPAILTTIIPVIKTTSKPKQTGINETILIPLLINETKFSSTSPPVKLTSKGQTAFPQTTVEITAPPITTNTSTDILRAIVPSKILSSSLMELSPITTTVSSTTDETTTILSVNVSSTAASLKPSSINETTVSPLLINETKFSSTSVPVLRFTTFPKSILQTSRILSTSLSDLSSITTAVSSTILSKNISSVNVSSKAVSVTPSKQYSTTSTTPGINETILIPLLINETKFSSTSPPVKLTSKGQTAFPQTTVEITAVPITTNTSTDILRAIVPSKILSSSLIELPPITTTVSSTTDETTTILSVNVSSTVASLTPSKTLSSNGVPHTPSINETTVSPLLINETKFSSTSVPVLRFTTFPKSILQTSRILPTSLSDLSTITTAVSSTIFAKNISSVNVSSKAVSVTPSKQYSTTSTTPAIATTIIPVIKTTSKPKQTGINETTVSPLLINETKFSSTSVPVLRFTTFPKSILQTSRILPTSLSDLSTITTAVSSTIFAKNISSVNVSSKAVSVTPSKQYSTTSTTPAILTTIIPVIKTTSKPKQTGINETTVSPLLINETKFSSTSVPVLRFTTFPKSILQTSRILPTSLSDLSTITTAVSSTIFAKNISSVNVSSKAVSVTPSKQYSTISTTPAILTTIIPVIKTTSKPKQTGINETTVSPLLINETKFSSTSVPVLRFTTFPKSTLQTSRILPTSLSDLSTITTAVSPTIFAKNISSVNVSSKAVSVTPSKQYSTTSTTPGINETTVSPLLINETKFSSTSVPVLRFTTFPKSILQTSRILSTSLSDLSSITTAVSSTILSKNISSVNVSSKAVSVTPSKQYSTTSTTPAIATTIIPVIKTTSKPKQTGINETILIPLLINETKSSLTSPQVEITSKGQTALAQTTDEITAVPITTNTSTDILRAIVPSKILSSSLIELPPITTTVSSTTDETTSILSVNASSTVASLTPSKTLSSNGVPHTPSINETTVSPLLINETKFSSTSVPVLRFTTFPKSILQTSRILPTSLSDLSTITTAVSSTIFAKNISSVNVSSKAVSVTPSKQYSTTSATPGINETILIPLLINETKSSLTSPQVEITSKGQTALPQTTDEITAVPITTNTSTDILRAIVPSKILSSSLIELPPITTTLSSTIDETTSISSVNASSTVASLTPSKTLSSNGVPHTPSINETTVSPLLINETKFSSTSVPVLRFTTFPKSTLQTSRILPTSLSDLSTITTAVSPTIFAKNISSVNVSSKAVSVTPSKQYSTTSTTPAILTTIIPVIKTTSKPKQTGINETILIPLLINETKFSSTSPPVKLTSKGQTAFPQTTVEITAAPITTNSSTDILRAIVPSKILSSSLMELSPITTTVSSTTDETTTILSVNVSSTAASLKPSSINETTVSPLLINETKFSSTSVPVLRFTTFPKSILQMSRILPTSLSDLSTITTAVSSTIFAKNISSFNVSSKAVSVTPSKQYSTTSTTPAIPRTIIPVIKTTSKPKQTGINETILIPLLINETKFSSTSPPVKLTSKGQTAFPQTTVEITAAPITTNSSTDILRAIVPSKILSSSLMELSPITTTVSSTTDETTTILSVNVSSTAASLKPSSINETTVSPLLINETKFSSTSVPVLRFTTFPKSILQMSRILPTSLSDLSTITTAVSSTIFAKNISSFNVSSKAVSVTPSKQYSTTSTTPAIPRTIIPVIKTTSKPKQTGINETILIPLLINETKSSLTSPQVKITSKGQTALPQTTVKITAVPITTNTSTDILRAIVPSKILSSSLIELPPITTTVSSTTDETTTISSVNVSSTAASLKPSSINETTVSPLLINETKFSSKSVPVLRFTAFPKSILQTSRILPTSLSDLSTITTAVSSTIFAKNISSVNVSLNAVSVTPSKQYSKTSTTPAISTTIIPVIKTTSKPAQTDKDDDDDSDISDDDSGDEDSERY